MAFYLLYVGVYVYMHTCTHTQFHTNRLTSGMYYILTPVHTYIYVHNLMHIHTVEKCTIHYSSFPLSLAQWGAELVQHLVAVLW